MKPKNMKNADELMAEYIANGEANLTADELRLIDLKVMQKTGKHIDKFKDKQKPTKPGGKDEPELVVSKSPSATMINAPLTTSSETL